MESGDCLKEIHMMSLSYRGNDNPYINNQSGQSDSDGSRSYKHSSHGLVRSNRMYVCPTF